MKKGRILFKGEYRGHRIVIVANTLIGIRCGYIQVPKEIVDRMETVEENIPFHGGVTFGPSESNWGDPGIWIGFHCGHFGDGFDTTIMSKEMKEFFKERKYLLVSKSANKIKKVIGEVGSDKEMLFETIKTTAYVKRVLRESVDWLVNFERMLKAKANMPALVNG